jgi:hypothetical protein
MAGKAWKELHVQIRLFIEIKIKSIKNNNLKFWHGYGFVGSK